MTKRSALRRTVGSVYDSGKPFMTHAFSCIPLKENETSTSSYLLASLNHDILNFIELLFVILNILNVYIVVVFDGIFPFFGDVKIINQNLFTLLHPN